MSWIPRFKRHEMYTPWGKQEKTWWEWRGRKYREHWRHI